MDHRDIRRLAFAEAERDVLVAQVQERNDEIKRQKSEYDRAIVRLEQAENELAQMRKALAELTISTRRSHEAELTSVREEYRLQRVSMSEDLSKLELSLDEMELHLSEVVAQRNSLHEEVDHLQGEQRVLTADYSDALDELNTMKIENRRLTQSLGEAQEKLVQLESDLQRVSKEADKAHRGNKHLRQDNEVLKEDIRTLTQRAEALEMERDHLRVRAGEQQTQLEYYQQSAQRLHQQLSQERTQLTNAAQAAAASHQKLLTDVQQALANATRELDHIKSTASQREHALIEQGQMSLQRFKTAASDDYATLMGRFSELEQSRAQLQTTLGAAQQENERLKVELEQERLRFQATAAEQAVQLHNELAQTRADRDRLRDQNDRFMRDTMTERNEMLAQAQAMTNEMATLKSSIEVHEHDSAILHDQIEELQKVNRSARERNVTNLKYMQQLLHKEEVLMDDNRHLEEECARLRLHLREAEKGTQTTQISTTPSASPPSNSTAFGHDRHTALPNGHHITKEASTLQ